MKLSALLLALITAVVVADPEPCTSKAPVKPTPQPEACTRMCASSPVQNCGRGWYSKQQGECWACCKKATPPPPPVELCTLICAAEPLQCAAGWYSKQQGACWSCCRSG